MLSEQQHPLSWHFNSRPSARGDGNMRNVLDIYTISIHAPPRGATDVDMTTARLYIISIHAPPRGATGSTPTYSV